MKLILKLNLEEDSNQMELWKVHHEHLTSVAQSDGKYGGNAPTVMQKRTNDARSSVYNATTGPSKGNNASAPTYDGKRKKY